VQRRDLAELGGAEEDRVLVAEGGGVAAVERVHDELRGVQGGPEGLEGDVGRLQARRLLREAALGAVGPAEPVVGLLRGGCELLPGLLPAVYAVLAEGVEDGGTLREVGLDGLGGADGLALGGEERGQKAAGVLGEAEDEEGPVGLREGGLGVGGGREEGVDPREEAGADAEGRLLDAGRV